MLITCPLHPKSEYEIENYEKARKDTLFNSCPTPDTPFTNNSYCFRYR